MYTQVYSFINILINAQLSVILSFMHATNTIGNLPCRRKHVWRWMLKRKIRQHPWFQRIYSLWIRYHIDNKVYYNPELKKCQVEARHIYSFCLSSIYCLYSSNSSLIFLWRTISLTFSVHVDCISLTLTQAHSTRGGHMTQDQPVSIFHSSGHKLEQSIIPGWTLDPSWSNDSQSHQREGQTQNKSRQE